MTKWGIAMVLALTPGCVGQVDVDDRAPQSSTAADAGSAYACTGDPDAGYAPVQATTEATACLDSMCAPAATCGDVSADKPVCVAETNGGILLSLYACPPGCCY